MFLPQVLSNLNQNGGQKIHKETGVTLQKNAKLPIKKQKAKLKNDALYLTVEIFESVTSQPQLNCRIDKWNKAFKNQIRTEHLLGVSLGIFSKILVVGTYLQISSKFV